MVTRIKTGTQDGTGAAISIVCGFRPRYVKVVNVATGGLCSIEHIDTMAAASGFKGVTAGTKTFISSNGITLNDFGFTIGADTDVNVSGEAIHYIAI